MMMTVYETSVEKGFDDETVKLMRKKNVIMLKLL